MLVFDMGGDDCVEVAIGLEAELARALRLEGRRPAGNDLLHDGVRRTADELHGFFPGDLAERLDLLADRRRDARHGQAAARPDR